MTNILEVCNLRKTFYKDKVPFPAVDDVSFSVKPGECLGIVGESGCGKTTIAKLITQLEQPESGMIFLDGKDYLHAKRKEKKEFYRKVQMVFQSPQDSFDPRHTLGDGIMEGLRNQGLSVPMAKKKTEELLELVELDGKLAGRYPHQVSGGQCQRAAIARALAMEPALLICDEATSALDVTVQRQIIELLKKLQRETQLSLLFICHDLALVQDFCDRVLVMYQGKIVEQGDPDEMICHPKEEYTKRLVDSILELTGE